MELWIRSQDGKKIYKVKEINFESCLAAAGISEYDIIINNEEFGIYKSRKRAFEVLDEIWNLLRGDWAIDFLNKNNMNMDNVFPIITYNMPKE